MSIICCIIWPDYILRFFYCDSREQWQYAPGSKKESDMTDRKMSICEVENTLRHFAQTGELTTNLAPEEFLVEIYEAWKANYENRSRRGGRKGRNARQVHDALVEHSSLPKIKNVIAKFADRAFFKPGDLPLLLQMFFQTWRGNELQTENVFAELAGMENALADSLNPTKGRFRLRSRTAQEVADASSRVHDFKVLKPLFVAIAEAWQSKKETVTVSVCHQFGQSDLKITVKTLEVGADGFLIVDGSQAEGDKDDCRLATYVHRTVGLLITETDKNSMSNKELLKRWLL